MNVRFLRHANVAGNMVSICIASEIRHAGFRRLIDAIDPDILNHAVKKVENALLEKKLFSAAQLGRTSTVTIVSVFHS